MNIHTFIGVFLPYFRRRRMKRFMAYFVPDEQTRILDVGGTAFNWVLCNCPSHITILNIRDPDASVSSRPNFEFVVGNALSLQYKDYSFDIAFSNSVIEHVSTFDHQKTFAKEVTRMSRNLWVQTPARSFFVEPHLLTPFIHFLPKSLQRSMIRNCTLWGLITRPHEKDVDKFLSEVRLLSYKEMKDLFPDCEILRERFLFFTKAYVACRRSP